jgi:hypothetical protein
LQEGLAHGEFFGSFHSIFVFESAAFRLLDIYVDIEGYFKTLKKVIEFLIENLWFSGGYQSFCFRYFERSNYF